MMIKKVVKFFGVCLCVCALASVSHAAPGDLDTTFSSDGKASSTLIAGGKAIALQGSSILMLGGTSSEWKIMRYLSDGSIDTTFGTSGVVSEPSGMRANAITVQPDGKFLVTGASFSPGFGTSLIVKRYTANGAVDTTFGIGGAFTSSPGMAGGGGISLFMPRAAGQSIAVVSGGKILVGGYGIQGGTNEPTLGALFRLNSDGTSDSTFSGGGYLSFGTHSIGNGFTCVHEGNASKVYAAMQYDSDILVARYTVAGAPDTNFDSDGQAIFEFGSSSTDVLGGLDVDSSNRPVVSGGCNEAFAVARFTTSGALDSTFGTGGKVVTNLNASADDQSTTVKVDANGKIVAGGYSNGDFALVRYTSAGALDTTFSGDGKLLVSFGGPDVGLSVAIQSDGKIVLGGNSNNTATDYSAVIRVIGDSSSTLKAQPPTNSTSSVLPSGSSA